MAEYREEVVDLANEGDTSGAFGGHGGGDLRLVHDWVNVLRGEAGSIATTTLEDSLNGHLIGFAADQAMEENRVVEMATLLGAGRISDVLQPFPVGWRSAPSPLQRRPGGPSYGIPPAQANATVLHDIGDAPLGACIPR